jgi:hypothetical protein
MANAKTRFVQVRLHTRLTSPRGGKPRKGDDPYASVTPMFERAFLKWHVGTCRCAVDDLHAAIEGDIRRKPPDDRAGAKSGNASYLTNYRPDHCTSFGSSIYPFRGRPIPGQAFTTI